MTLVELRLLRFRQHRDRCFSFSPGLNVVVGPNEAGKSALREALRCVLFDNPEGASQRSREGLVAWGEEWPPVLELVFEYQGSRYELRKDFHERRVVLRGRDGVRDRHRLVQPILHDALGFQSEKAFLATAHVRQAELHAIGEQDVAAQLGRIVAGADEDASQALRALERALGELERGLERPASNPGRLARARRRVEELEVRVQELRREMEAARSTASELESTRRRLEDLRKGLLDRQALLELNRRVVQAQERREHLRQELERLEARREEVERLRQDLAGIRAQLESLPDLTPQDAERVREALEQAQGLRANAQRLVEPDPSPAVARPGPWPWVVALVALGAAALPDLPWPLRLALLAVAAAAAWAGWRQRERAARDRAALEARQLERTRLARSLEEKADSLEAFVRAELQRFGAASREQLQQWAAERARLETSYRELQARLEAVLGDSDEVRLEEDARRLRADLRTQTDFLKSDEVRGKILVPLEIQRMEREVEELEGERQELEARLRRLEARLEAAVEEEALLRAEEELAAARAELQRLERRRRALRVATEVLQEAKRAVEVPARQAVEERAGQFLSELTGGRYSRLRVPPEAQTLRVEVWSEEAGRWLPPQEPHLSRGTVDLVFLAARVALVDVLAPRARPPLLLDDPFVTFDPERRARALRWLRTLATERQVLLFTWDEAAAPSAQGIIRLP